MADSDLPALSDLDAASEARPRSFSPAEMITCDECLRANPPTRSQCIYCAAHLPGSIQTHPQAVAETADIGQPAKSTDACYLVLVPIQTNLAESSLAAVASLLHLKSQEVASLVGFARPVPLARSTTAEQGAVLADKLRTLGVEVDTFPEDAINLGLAARKIRALEFSDDGLTATPLKGGEISVGWDDLTLIVIGRLVVSRVEVEERRRRGRQQPLGTRELFSDDPVMDLYVRSDEAAWRISPNGFDFSCLGPEKAMTAFQNLNSLIDLLKIRAPKAEVDDSYRSLRPVLANIWSLEPKTRKGEWRRSGAGKFDVATVTTTNNEGQFNSYSRLSHRLKLGELEGGQ